MLDIFKNPLFCMFLGGVVTLGATTTYQYNSTHIASCDAQIEIALNELRQELQAQADLKEADISKALAPNPTPLDDDREGGLSWNN